jgi:hypothetical protein
MAVVAASLGLGMGYAIARVVTKVNQLVNKVVKPITAVVKSVKSLVGAVQQVRSLFSGAADKAQTSLNSSSARITMGAGLVVDASDATYLGNTKEAQLREAALVADRTSHENSAVLDIARTDTSIIDGLPAGGGDDWIPAAGGVDWTPTADSGAAGMTGSAVLGTGGGASATLTGGGAAAGHLGSAGLGAGGLGTGLAGTAGAGTGGMMLGAGGVMPGRGLAGGGVAAGSARPILGSGLAGGTSGIRGTTATPTSSGSGAGARPLTGPMHPVSNSAAGSRSRLGARKGMSRDIIIETDEDDED